MWKGRRWVTVLLVLGMLVSHLASGVSCDGAESGAGDIAMISGVWSYELLEDGGASITGYTGNEANLRVPDELDGHKVVCIGKGVFQGNETVLSVEFPDTLQKIGSDAFNNCRFTGELKIPDGVEEIGAYAFYDNTRLTGDLILPSSLKKIGQYAFRFCGKMKGELTLPQGITRIEEGAFEDCGFTGTLTIPRSVTEIENWAFHGASGIKKIIIPRETVYIGESSFGNVSATVYGYEGSEAQAYANGHGMPFVDLEKEPTPQPTEPPTEIKSGVWSYELLEDGGASITGYTGNEANLRIPDELEGHKVVCIGEGVFQGNKTLVSVEFPDILQEIGDNAFCECINLTGTLTIPDAVTTIGSFAFYSCRFTGELKIPDGVEEIGAYAFYNNTRLTGDLTLPSSLKKIGQYAFRLLRDMKGELTLPQGITRIEEGAFEDCGFTGTLTIPRSVTEIEDYAFHSASGIQKIIIPRETVYIGESSFGNVSATVYGYEGSEAQAYANWHEMPFVDLEKEPTSTQKPTVPIPETEAPTAAPTRTPTVPIPETEAPTAAPTRTPTVPIPETETPTAAPTRTPTVPIPGTELPTAAPARTPTVPIPETETPTAAPTRTPTVPIPETEMPTAVPLPETESPAVTPTPGMVPAVSPPAAQMPGEPTNISPGTGQQNTGILSGQLKILGVRSVADDVPKMKWNRNPFATRYEIFRSRKKKSGFRKIRSLSSAQTEFTDRTVKRGDTWYYKIRAVYEKTSSFLVGEYSDVLRLRHEYLHIPVVKVKRVGKDGRTEYLKFIVRKSEGKKIQIYFGKGKKKKIVRLQSTKIKRIYRLQYKASARHMTFYVRTYVKKAKHIYFSRFAVIKI